MRLLTLTAVVFAFSGLVFSQSQSQLNLMPVPASVQSGSGQLPITQSFSVAVSGAHDASLDGAVERFTTRLSKLTGIPLRPPAGSPATLTVHAEHGREAVQKLGEDESYELAVTSSGATLNSATTLGALHGLQTFLQLVTITPTGFAAPAVTIKDQPRFPWRGTLIDVSRHFIPLDVLKRNLDGMAAVKMNVLHWHLSDDQGFRVESKKFPKLSGVGSDNQFYTQEQIRDFLAYAHDRGIRVMPEFDIPGHSRSWMIGYPDLASGPGPYTLETGDPIMDPTRESTYKFLGTFIAEMAKLFPDEYFHIGGDEVNGKQWNSNPQIQRFMVRHGLKTNEDLQAYFNGRLEKILTKHHKKMMGWDEILHPDLPKTILVQSWRGADGLVNCAKQGYDTILSNGYYLDLSQPASVHYAVDPIPTNSPLTDGEKTHVLGGEACMWSELVSAETVDSRLWPRTLAVAERLWSPDTVTNVDDFYGRMEVESVRLEGLGLTHRSNYLPMLERLAGGTDVKPLKILADVVEPVKNYQRHRSRVYTSDFPLDRLVDAVRCESASARAFHTAVDSYLGQGPKFGDASGLLKPLRSWEENHKALGPVLEGSDKTVEAAVVSQDLSFAAQLGRKALGFLGSGQPPNALWADKAQQILDRAQEPHAEVQIAVIPAIRKLVLAACQQDKLKTMTVTDWNKSLDDQVAAKNPKGWN